MYLEERVESLEKLCKELSNHILMLEARGKDEILTPAEFSKRIKVNQNTVYCWIREGKIKTLANIGTALRIPMSQFYEDESDSEEWFPLMMEEDGSDEEIVKKPQRKKISKSKELKRDFEDYLKQKNIV